MYNGWTEPEILIALCNITDDFKSEGMAIAVKLEDTINELGRAFTNNDIYIDGFKVLAEAITEADNMDMYGAGDTLMDIMIALKEKWNMNTDD